MENKMTTIEEAFQYIGEDPTKLPNTDNLLEEDKVDSITNFQLKKVIKAINKKFNNGEIWICNPADHSQKKWEPIFYIDASAGFVFYYSYYHYSDASAGLGSRLAFISKEACEYMASTPEFLNLYKQQIVN